MVLGIRLKCPSALLFQNHVTFACKRYEAAWLGGEYWNPICITSFKDPKESNAKDLTFSTVFYTSLDGRILCFRSLVAGMAPWRRPVQVEAGKKFLNPLSRYFSLSYSLIDDLYGSINIVDVDGLDGFQRWIDRYESAMDLPFLASKNWLPVRTRKVTLWLNRSGQQIPFLHRWYGSFRPAAQLELFWALELRTHFQATTVIYLPSMRDSTLDGKPLSHVVTWGACVKCWPFWGLDSCCCRLQITKDSNRRA